MATYSVKSTSELMAALKKAQGGDVVNLAAGDYGAVVINNLKFASGVTIQSSSLTNPAHLGSLKVADSSNLTFAGLDIGGSTSVANASFKAFVSGSSNIVMDSVHIHGTLDGDAQNDTSGLRVLSSSNVTIKNSEFQQLTRGAFFEKSNTINFSGNNVHDIRMDGSAFAEVKNVVIDSNRFTNFDRKVEDHSDAIQFWTTGTTTASTDITITNNQILQGTGTAQQGIFMGNELGISYERVTIANNLIYESGYANGLTVTKAKDVTVTGNTVISSSNIAGATKIRIESVTNGTISNNLTDQFYWLGTSTNLTKTGNVSLVDSPATAKTIQDLTAAATAVASRLVLSGVGYKLAGVGNSVQLGTPVVTTPTTPTIPTTGGSTGSSGSSGGLGGVLTPITTTLGVTAPTTSTTIPTSTAEAPVTAVEQQAAAPVVVPAAVVAPTPAPAPVPVVEQPVVAPVPVVAAPVVTTPVAAAPVVADPTPAPVPVVTAPVVVAPAPTPAPVVTTPVVAAPAPTPAPVVAAPVVAAPTPAPAPVPAASSTASFTVPTLSDTLVSTTKTTTTKTATALTSGAMSSLFSTQLKSFFAQLHALS